MSAHAPVVIQGLDPERYRPPALSGGERAWPETNCYIDLWMSVLNALGLDSLACLPFVFQADFEGDQWTFLKPSLDDLWRLYRVDVQELNIWDSLPAHLLTQVERGNLPLVEVDSFFLPDTAGTAYRDEHTKTTIGVNSLDLGGEQLGYFHNSGYFTLSGEDFRHLLHVGARSGESLSQVPYTEFAKLGHSIALPADRLLELSLECARNHLGKRPRRNPLLKFRESLAAGQVEKRDDPVAYYHRNAFATVRQLGAAFQMGAAYARWIDAGLCLGLEEAAEAMDEISSGAKALLFKMARSANTGKPLQYEDTVCVMAEQWETAFELLPNRLGCS